MLLNIDTHCKHARLRGILNVHKHPIVRSYTSMYNYVLNGHILVMKLCFQKHQSVLGKHMVLSEHSVESFSFARKLPRLLCTFCTA